MINTLHTIPFEQAINLKKQCLSRSLVHPPENRFISSETIVCACMKFYVFCCVIGVRIMEVRTAYARGDFEWEYMQKISVQELEKRNTDLMRHHADEAFGKAFQHE